LKSIYLHIGLPRCASTLIEEVFNGPQYDLYKALRASGIKPLTHLYRELRKGVARPKWGETLLTKLREQYILPLVNDSDYGDSSRGYFVTDEGLTFVNDKKGNRGVHGDRAPFMARLLEGFQARVILIVRNQVSYIESCYGLHIQNGGKLDFETYFRDFPLENLDWLDVADTFAQVFGEQQVSVFPFEPRCYDAEDVPYANFMDAICKAMGIEQPVDMERLPLANPSLDPKLLPAQLEINRTFEPETASEIRKILCRAVPKPRGASPSLLRGEEIESVRRRYAETNNLMFDRYMPQFDRTPYMPAG